MSEEADKYSLSFSETPEEFGSVTHMDLNMNPNAHKTPSQLHLTETWRK